MSKAIVLYNSKSGNTKKVAMKIAEGLGVECKDLRNIPKLKDYDLIVVGSWVIMGRISFAGARLIRRIRRKTGKNDKQVALFFTSGAPDDIHPFTEKSDNPRVINEIMFTSMEKRLKKNKYITILPERFYCKGTARMFGKENEPLGHPTDEELSKAKAFGEELSKLL
jgi:flavodoxin